jgi:hypothetical protein
MAVGRDAGTAEAHSHEELFDRFRDRLPKEFIFERELLRSRLWRSPERWELAHELRVDPIAHLGGSVMHAAGCTWGARAGGLSRPRQRPPAIFRRPCRGLSMRALGRRWRAGR